MEQVLGGLVGLRRREAAGGDEVVLGGEGRGGCGGGTVEEEAVEGGGEMHGVKAGEGIPYRREHRAGGGAMEWRTCLEAEQGLDWMADM
jgi:hypothetical protein